MAENKKDRMVPVPSNAIVPERDVDKTRNRFRRTYRG